MRKTRPDAILLNLPPDQQDRICDWLLEGVETDEGRDTSYRKVCEQIYLDFGVKTSETALRGFYQKVVAPKRLRRAADAAEEFGEDLQAEGGQFERAALAILKQKFFEVAACDRVDVEQLLAFGSFLSGQQKLTLKREELKLSRDKFLAQIKTKIDAGIDALFAEIEGNPEAEALITRLREIVNREVQAA